MSGADPLAPFDFDLPESAIAQQPAEPRDDARLLHVERAAGRRSDARVRDLPALLQPGDLLVVNASRVLPAKLRGRKLSGGGAEALLLGPGASPGRLRALLRLRGRLRVGQKLRFERGAAACDAEVVAVDAGGEVELAFDPECDPYALGEAPLPPYIRRPVADDRDPERYQCVFAREPGSVAAPTAGLHFTAGLRAALARRGIGWAELVLHVGSGTFRPLRPEHLSLGRLHPETYTLPEATTRAIATTHRQGGRIVAVGTTVTRVLESCAGEDGRLRAGRGETSLFVQPGHRFRAVDALLTNFHLPRSSLLLLVAAFLGREATLAAYRTALVRGYRFTSYGDAMLIQ